jgi:23S rRNA maturation mini-RNase III
MTPLQEVVKAYVQRALNAMDDMFIAIEVRDTAKQHTALAALIGLLEMLKAELERGGDDNGDSH